MKSLVKYSLPLPAEYKSAKLHFQTPAEYQLCVQQLHLDADQMHFFLPIGCHKNWFIN